MTVANLSVIVAGYALYLNVKDLHGIFTLYCQQTKEHFVFLSESMTNSRLFLVPNVKKNGENYRIVDYKEKKAYDFELVKGE